MKKMILNGYEKNRIKEMYDSGFSVIEISKFFNYSKPIIYRELKEYGVNFKNRKYNVDGDYFHNIDTEEKAYWLGFLYADGYVRIHKGRSGQLRLKLKRDDYNHIEKFKNAIKSDQLILITHETLRIV